VERRWSQANKKSDEVRRTWNRGEIQSQRMNSPWNVAIHHISVFARSSCNPGPCYFLASTRISFLIDFSLLRFILHTFASCDILFYFTFSTAFHRRTFCHLLNKLLFSKTAGFSIFIYLFPIVIFLAWHIIKNGAYKWR